MGTPAEKFFKTTVGVLQGCFLSPILFILFIEKRIQETLHDHHTSISTGGRPQLCNLRFADDIDLMSGSNGGLRDLTNRLVDREEICGMEVSTKKGRS